MPGWAWLVVGLVLGAGVLWLGASMGDGDNDFLRPRPNPDARPPEAAADDPIASEDAGRQFDFYTLLPGDGEAMSDEELAASARAEAEAAAADPGDDDDADGTPHPDAADLADPPAGGETAGATDTPGDTGTDDGRRYLLQAGAFGDAGDAEAVKARIALLGLGARVESATLADGRIVYRVRMGPYDSAAALADAKRKLAEGGLPSLAIRAR